MSEEQEHIQQMEEYLQQHHISSLLQGLLTRVIHVQPQKLLDFLIEEVQAPPPAISFVVGPPGLALTAALQRYHQNVFDSGAFISKLRPTYSEQCGLLYRDQELENLILKQINKEHKSCIVEGYPKTLKQAISLRNIIPAQIMFVNVDDRTLTELCYKKAEKLKVQDVWKYTHLYAMEYKICLNQLKQFYPKYHQIDVSLDRSEETIVKLMKKHFQTKKRQQFPSAPLQILVMGSPLSGRTTLGHQIAQKYSLVYISTSILIADEIKKNSVHSNKLKSLFQSNELVDSFTIEKLIEERISKRDCKMQGLVLEGYPKTKEQYENLKSIKVRPTLLVAVDCPYAISQARTQIDLSQRFKKWDTFKEFLYTKQQQILFLDPNLNAQNMLQEVTFELEK